MWLAVKNQENNAFDQLGFAGRFLLGERLSWDHPFLKNVLTTSHRRIETRYDTCWVVEKRSVCLFRPILGSSPSQLRMEIQRSCSYRQRPSQCSSWKDHLCNQGVRCHDFGWGRSATITFFTKYPTQCSSWLHCWSWSDGGSLGCSRSLGRSCQETRRYRRVDGLDPTWCCARY